MEEITKPSFQSSVGRPADTTATKFNKKERRELAARIRRFKALSPQLQEGVLRYGEQLQNSYRS